jgi:hypothetical protein
MCDICDRVKPGIDVNEKSEILQAIGKEIIACDDCMEHFAPIMDILLDTVLQDRDPYIEAHWEESYRNSQED